MWVIGIPLSHIIGSSDDLDKLNPDLIAPQAKFLIPKRLLHVELPLSNALFDDDYKNENETKGSKLVTAQNEWMWSSSKERESEKQ